MTQEDPYSHSTLPGVANRLQECGEQLFTLYPGGGGPKEELRCVLPRGHAGDHRQRGLACGAQLFHLIPDATGPAEPPRCVLLAGHEGPHSPHPPPLREPPHDPVNNPPHYVGEGGLQAIDVIEAFGLGYRLGNAVKYVLRAGRKDGAPARQDLEKARWYLTREIERCEREEQER